jgi:hypothetical protein
MDGNGRNAGGMTDINYGVVGLGGLTRDVGGHGRVVIHY